MYLRQPGQSSRGPAFRIHSDTLKSRGFQSLLDRCVTRPSWPTSRDCLLNSCPGCDKHGSATELYIPAPATASVDAVFDHHITTRNFFAWLYDLPLAGRTLGVSLVALKERIDQHRSARDRELTKSEVISFAESQGYLDFRECVDHALAALMLADRLQQEDLWVDAFVHAVGMSHRDITTSLEYSALNEKTKNLIFETRLEMDVRLARASLSIETFFGDDLSGNFLGLSQTARDHFDRFRSFLHAFYIEKYGFWPPAGFSTEASRYSIYKSLYSDFRSLYHHLVDEDCSANTTDMSGLGGVCIVQNIQAFDSRHGFETLPKPLPRLPKEPTTTNARGAPILSRRKSWNPISQKRIDRETKKRLRAQALIDASNRDMNLMVCPLVRRYSEYESKSINDDLEPVSWIDGRKVRWILIYAILQTLVSIMAAPKLVRNTEGLSYSLCCHIPKQMPWASKVPVKNKGNKELAPDIDYLHTNASTGNLDTRASNTPERKGRRLSMPTRINSTTVRASSVPRTDSLRRLLSKRRKTPYDEQPPVPSPPSQPFCEILVHGYGNGLNEVELRGKKSMTFPTPEQIQRRNSLVPDMEEVPCVDKQDDRQMPHDSLSEDDVPALSTSSSATVSRETSNASTTSKATKDSDELVTPVDDKSMTHLIDILKATAIDTPPQVHIESYTYDEIDGLPGSIHINTKTWDEILG